MNTTTHTITNARRRATLGLFAGAALTLAPLSGASAQRVIEIGEDVHRAHAHSVHQVTSGDEIVRIESDGDTAEVWHNGRHVTTLDLDESWTNYQVHNDEGELVATVVRSGAGSSNFVVFVGDENAPMATPPAPAPRAALWRVGESGALASVAGAGEMPRRLNVQISEERPRVMIGITADTGSTATDALRELSIDPDDVVRISTVVDGGPAARAGIRPGDIVLSIDDQKSGNLKAIRTALSERDPGDRVNVVVLREGQKQRYTLTLDPFKAEAFPSGSLDPDWTPADPWGVGDMAEIQATIEQKGAYMGELAAKMAQVKGREAEELRREMAKASKEIAELSQRLARQSLRRQLSGGGEMELEFFEDAEGGGRRAVLLPFSAPRATSNEDLERRFEELSARLEDQLDRFEDRMDEMNDEIDRKLDELVDELIRRMRERSE